MRGLRAAQDLPGRAGLLLEPDLPVRPWVIVAMLLMAGAVFMVRTAMQPHYKPCDFAVYYTGSHAWIAGHDPYDRQAALDHWRSAGGRADIMPGFLPVRHGLDWMPILQLPMALPLFAPFAWLPAGAAIASWYALCFVLLILQSMALASLAGTGLWRRRGLFLLVVTLLLAPVHESFGYAQPSGPVISLIVLAIWAAQAGRELLGGALLAAAVAAKPQLAGLFFAYYLFTGRWRCVAAFVAVIVSLSIIAIAPMEAGNIPWASGWHGNFQIAEAPGGLNSTSIENTSRHYLLNLQVLLHGIVTERWLVNLLALLITGTLAVVFAYRAAPMGRQDQLLALGALSALSLLPVYHRFYDAALLVIPLAWGVVNLHRQPRLAWPVLLFVLSFLIPVAAVPRLARFLGADPAQISTGWWNIIVEPFRIWSIIIGFGLLIRAMSAGRVSRWADVLAEAETRIRSLFPSRAVAAASIWIVVIMVALMLDGLILRLVKPYAHLIRESAVTHELREIGHIIFALLVALLVWVLHSSRWHGAVLVFSSAVLAKIFYTATQAVVFRPRLSEMIAPYDLPALDEVVWRVTRMYDYIWPSGHTVISFAIAAAMSHLLPRGRWAFFGVAMLVGLARMGELAHYPSEIIVYAGLGIYAFHLSRAIQDQLALTRAPDRAYVN